MPVELKLNAEPRADLGKGASRRLRRANKVPAVLYGADKEVLSLQLDARQLDRLMQEEAFYSQILTIKIGKKSEPAQVKDLQRHPVKPFVLHVDLQRVVSDQIMHSRVPLHFTGQEEAVKLHGGVFLHDLNEIEVACLPKDLPQNIEVDCSQMTLGQSLHLSSLVLPEGVTIPSLVEDAEHDIPVVTLIAPRVSAADEAADEAEAAGGEEAEESGDEE